MHLNHAGAVEAAPVALLEPLLLQTLLRLPLPVLLLLLLLLPLLLLLLLQVV